MAYELETHVGRANNYIGAANLAARVNDGESPAIAAALARAEAILALADAVDRLAAAVREVGGVPAPAR